MLIRVFTNKRYQVFLEHLAASLQQNNKKMNDSHVGALDKKVRENPGSATITNRSPSQTLRGRGNRQNQTSANRTNVLKALRIALSSQSEVIAMLKGLILTVLTSHKTDSSKPFSNQYFLGKDYESVRKSRANLNKNW